MTTRETYTRTETAAILGLSHATLLRHIAAGTVPVIRLGRRTLIPRTYVDQLFSDAGCPRVAANA